jgi:hypothetical protein
MGNRPKREWIKENRSIVIVAAVIVKSLQKEISDLQGKMADKRVDFELEARKIAPNARFGRGYGRGYGQGYGRYGTMGRNYGPYGQYGPHHGQGYGPCWQ